MDASPIAIINNAYPSTGPKRKFARYSAAKFCFKIHNLSFATEVFIAEISNLSDYFHTKIPPAMQYYYRCWSIFVQQ